MIVRLGNSRLQAFVRSGLGVWRKKIDRHEDFDLVRRGDAEPMVEFSSTDEPPNKHERLRFLNFVERCSRGPIAVDGTPVFEPLVKAVCQEALAYDSTGSRKKDLIYMIPFNAGESLWSSLPQHPFVAGNVQVEPVGFIDELMLMLFIAAQRLLDYPVKPPFELYIVFQLDMIPTACRVECTGYPGNLILRPVHGFQLSKVSPTDIGSVPHRAILRINDPPIEEGEIDRFMDFVNQDERKAQVHEPVDATWEEILSRYLDTRIERSKHRVEIRLPNYLGICREAAEDHVLISHTNTFPAYAGGMARFSASTAGHELTFFRGCFPDAALCRVFNPIELSDSTTAGDYQITTLLEDSGSARISVNPIEYGPSRNEHGLTVTLRSPSGMFRERVL